MEFMKKFLELMCPKDHKLKCQYKKNQLYFYIGNEQLEIKQLNHSQ